MDYSNIISYENCQKVFENYLKSKNFLINNVVVESLANEVSGMMAEYYKLIITATVDNKSVVKQFFCKKLVMFHKIQEIMGKAQGAYEKEDYIYNFLIYECNKIPNFKVNYAPKCYLTLKDDLFVLEDLIELGYSTAKKRSDLKHCKLGLEALAEFHASSIIFEENQSTLLGKKYSLYDSNPDVYKDSLYRKPEDYLGRHWFKNCVNAVSKVIDLLPETESNKKVIQDKLAHVSNKVYEIITPSKIYKNVCCHGDMSDANVLYRYENENPVQCKIVDYQALRYNPPAHDVLNFIYLTSDKIFRKENYDDLLKFYFEALQKQLLLCNMDLSKFITKEQYYDSCDYILPQVVLQKALYCTMRPVIALFPNIVKDQDLYKRYVYEDRSQECIKAFEMSNTFKEDIIDIIHELCSL